MIYEMQKIPEQGEKFQYQNLEFTLISVDGPRLKHIQIQRFDRSATAPVDDILLMTEGESLLDGSSTADSSSNVGMDGGTNVDEGRSNTSNSHSD